MSDSFLMQHTEVVPDGVQIKALTKHADQRGYLFEAYRQSSMSPPMIQWNYNASYKNTLRGVHLHVAHTDYLTLLEGIMLIGMRDIRMGSKTEGLTSLVKFVSSEPRVIIIPPGVMHGFYFPENSRHLYGMDCYWDEESELGCRWDDPVLNIPWPSINPILSTKDDNAPSFQALMQAVGTQFIGRK